MLAVFRTGNQQFCVRPGDVLNIHQLPQTSGASIEFDEVLCVSPTEDEAAASFGSPYLENARVHATVIDNIKGPKIRVLKFKRRKHHMKRMGHRQDYTQIRIDKITT